VSALALNTYTVPLSWGLKALLQKSQMGKVLLAEKEKI
jgi:hypothetical protein